MRKLFLFLLLCCLFLFSSCADSSQQNFSSEAASSTQEPLQLCLSMYGRDTNWISQIEKLTADFSALHPDIEIRLDFCTSGSYTEYLNAKEATGTLPDIFELLNPSEYYRANKLGKFPQDIAALTASPFENSDNCYALPIFSSINGIAYNQKIFKELNLSPPQDYREFLNICQMLKEHGYTPIAFAGNDEQAWDSWSNYYFSLMQSGSPDWLLKKEQNMVSFNSPEIIHMLENFQNLFHSAYVPDSYSNISQQQIPELLINEKAAMAYTNPGIFALLSDLDVDFSTGWFYMPDKDGNPSAVNAVISYWGISSLCEDSPEKLTAACEFLKFFYQKDNYRSILQATSTFSTTAQVVLYPSLEIIQSLRAEYIYANINSSYLGDLHTPPAFMDGYRRLLRLLMIDAISPQEAAEQMELLWNTSSQN